VSRGPSDVRSAASSGFTLLELLLAVVILGLVLASVYGGVARTASSKNIAEERAELFSNGRKAVLKVASDLEGAIPPLLGDRIFFRGNQSEVEFIIINRGGYFSNGLQSGRVWIAYSVEPNPGQSGTFALKREEYLYAAALAEADGTQVPAPPDGQDAAPTSQLSYLLDCPAVPDDLNLPGTCMRVIGLQFRYYDDQVRDWRDEWDTTQDAEFERLPAMVQISMLVADKDGKQRDFSTVVDLPLSRGQPTPEPTRPGQPQQQQSQQPPQK
jgi:prepilin-type N-terminal cleavage/methylation domain-containing protein